MKRNYIASLLLVVLISVFALSCNNNSSKQAGHQQADKEQEYTCPMHPQVVQDKPGSCPICGMDLVPRKAQMNEDKADTTLSYLLQPVNEQVIARIPTFRAEKTSKILTSGVPGRVTYDTRAQTSIASRVGGRIEKLYIKYNYQPVKKGQPIMEIYAPELAAAQRELLFIARNGNQEGMLQGARERLLLLGMTPGQIASVLKTGKVIYRVPVYSNATGYILEKSAGSPAPATPAPSGGASGSSGSGDGMSSMGATASTPSAASGAAASTSPVLLREGQYVSAGQSVFTIYNSSKLVAEFSLTPATASNIRKGASLIIQTSNKQKSFQATIGLVQPVFAQGENFTLARVYLNHSKLRVGELVSGKMPVMARDGWWVPKEALISLGSQWVVFKKEGKVFIPQHVPVGASGEGQVQILQDLSGWEIARNAYYLIDSESFIKVANNTKK